MPLLLLHSTKKNQIPSIPKRKSYVIPEIPIFHRHLHPASVHDQRPDRAGEYAASSFQTLYIFNRMVSVLLHHPANRHIRPIVRIFSPSTRENHGPLWSHIDCHRQCVGNFSARGNAFLAGLYRHRIRRPGICRPGHYAMKAPSVPIANRPLYKKTSTFSLHQIYLSLFVSSVPDILLFVVQHT